MKIGSLTTVAVSAMVLAACGTADIDALRKAEVSGSDFNSQLAKEYKGFSVYEADAMYDFPDSRRYAQKGLKALKGDAVLPEDPANWDIDGTEGAADARQSRNRLMTALASGAATKAPAAAARAQANYDCWLEQLEEGWQYDHIAACRDAFKAAMQEVDLAMRPTPVVDTEPQALPVRPVVVVPADYRVYFNWDSAEITDDARETLRLAVIAAKEADPVAITVVGHADRSGPRDYNRDLSKMRAEAVAREVARLGIAPSDIVIAAAGEADPAVPTADGVREPQNRRVRISIGSDAAGA